VLAEITSVLKDPVSLTFAHFSFIFLIQRLNQFIILRMWATIIKEKGGWARRGLNMKWLRSLNRSRIYHFLSESVAMPLRATDCAPQV
jgi:hypothetical protein